MLAQNIYGARKFLLAALTKERSLDREAIEECEKLSIANKQTLAEILVSEGVVTDQELGLQLEKFAKEGYINPAELSLLTSEFSSNWERWREMEEQDEQTAEKQGAPEAQASSFSDSLAGQPPAAGQAQPMPSEAVIEESGTASAEERKQRPLTEKLHGGSLQDALEQIMDKAPVKEYTHHEKKPEEEKPPAQKAQEGSLQEALEEAMHEAPVKEYPSGRVKAVEDAAAEPVTGRRIGGAKIVSRVGKGEFGTVYKGVLEESGKTVAVRLIPSDTMLESARARVLEHAELATRVKHRNVAEVTAAGEQDEYVYVISEFVDGETLRARLERQKKLPQEEALDAALQVARALRASHAMTVCHADVKPENIFFDKEGQAVVTDLGLAKSAEIDKSTSSRQALFMGNPRYMAPEQFEAQQPDARTDVYALGIVLYEMLTGALPFDGATAFAIRDAHLAGKPELVTQVDSSLSPTVAKLVAKMIDRRADHRYQEMTKLINDMVDLKQYLTAGGDEPPVAQPDIGAAPDRDAEVRARAEKYKTVTVSPEKAKARRLKPRHVIMVLALLSAVGVAAYTFITKPDFIKFQASMEEEDAKKFEEIKRKAEFLLSQEKYLTALQELDKFPPTSLTSQARRDLDKYRDEIFDQVDKAFAGRKEDIILAYKEKRVQDATRKSRALKFEAEQILEFYGERWPKAAELKKKYVDFAEEREVQIGEKVTTLDKVKKEFEEDTMLAEKSLKKDTLKALEEAHRVIEKYLTGTRDPSLESMYAEAEKLMQRIVEKEKFFKDQAKKRELESFEKAEEEARKDIEHAVELLKLMKRAGELLINFEEDRKRAEELSEENNLDEALKAVMERVINPVVRHRDEARELAQRIAEKAKELKKAAEKAEQEASGKAKEAAKRDRERAERLLIKFKEDMERAGQLSKSFEGLLNKDNVDEDFNTALGRIKKFENSEQQIVKIEAMAIVADIEKNRREYLAEMAEVKRWRLFEADIERGHELIAQEKYEEARRKVAEYEDDQRLSDEEKEALSKLKYEAERHIKFVKDLAKIKDLISKKRLNDARRACLSWRLDPDKKIRDTANKKFLEIMDAREPGMAYIEGGVAILGSDDGEAYLFSADAEGLEKQLKEGIVSEELKDIFKTKEFPLSENASINEKDGWEILSREGNYIIKKKGGKLKIYSRGKYLVVVGDNNPKRRKTYSTFYIDRREVTCGQYESFVTATNRTPPANWPRETMPRQWARRPVTGITWEDAAAYAKWAGKRLPTETQWEIAASWDGKNKMLYPWGAGYVEGNSNIATGKLTDVGSRAGDKSPNGIILDTAGNPVDGIFDMAGNAAEWTATKLEGVCVVRGGSAAPEAKPEDARTARRSFLDPKTTNDFLGFRCAKDTN